MFVPDIASGIKKSHNLPADRVDAAQIRAFMDIAAITRQRQIVLLVPTAVLLSDNVLYLKSRKGKIGLSEPAVPRSSLPLFGAPRLAWPRPSDRVRPLQHQPGFRLQHANKVDHIDKRLIFLHFRLA